jgi:pyridoxal phosphate enzyme (YggS family)
VDLEANFRKVRERIEAACTRAGRNASGVTVVAVTKSHPPETIRAAVEAGQLIFGENRVQEAKAKIPLCPERIRWHMIGHLQSNKARDAVALFSMIQSVDSLNLAQELEKWAEKQAKTMPILLEVNIAGESSKFGYKPEAVLRELTQINQLRHLEVRGLMTIAPWTNDAEKVRPVFRKLRELKSECEQVLGAPLQHLSMGMSGDFEVAIEEGATMVRIGTALFGPRTAARKAAAEAREEAAE